MGCGNADGPAGKDDDPPPAKNRVTWHCFCAAEVPFWTGIFGNVDTAAAVARLHGDLGAILTSDPQFHLVESP